MIRRFIDFYVFHFAKIRFYKLNIFLLKLALGGIGVLNYRSSRASGEKSFLNKFLKSKSGVIIDVGSNKGDFAIEVNSINNNLDIYAFEPHPKTFSSLRERTAGCKRIFTVNMALSDSEGQLYLYDYPNKDGSEHASIFSDVITAIHGKKDTVSYEVQVTTVDKFLDFKGIDVVDLLKIDTEGNELSVIKGALNSIKANKIRAIQFEFNEMNVVSRVFFKDFSELLSNYDLYRLLPNEMLLIDKYSPLLCEIFAYQNIVAIVKE